jgi:inosine-uridine nucleoside N-ribohydrolase
VKLHLDTDIGGDIDDLAALAMLLKWPGVELTGVTTVADDGGRRAGYANYVLGLASRSDVPVAAGADVSGGYYRDTPGYPGEAPFWPEPVTLVPGPLDAAVELLRDSVEQGATIVGIGPCTNLALLDRRYPGVLRDATVCLVGGYVELPRSTRSRWGNAFDYNFQQDVASAQHVLTHARPTLVPLHVTVETTLTHAQLPTLAGGDAISALLARQAAAYAATEEFEAQERELCADLPADFINHLYDPLACAVALGWPGATVSDVPLTVSIEDGWLHERVSADGALTRVAMAVDGPAFDALWLRLVSS